VDLLPVVNSEKLDLVDNQKAVNQLCSLERRTARSGRESIDHPPNAHDDLANVIAGVVAECRKAMASMVPPPSGPRIIYGDYRRAEPELI
jgi:hypothetical protein